MRSPCRAAHRIDRDLWQRCGNRVKHQSPGLLFATDGPSFRLPLVDQMVVRLGQDAAIRAKLRGEDDAAGARLLARDAQLLKDHLMKRRQFLLGQQELWDGGRGSRQE
jgi:hypothetical protein